MGSIDRVRRVALSTKDNPFNPITQFDDWYLFDVEKGYNTCSYLARIAKTANTIGDYFNDLAIEAAIDEILQYNVTGNYIKVVEYIEKPVM